MPLRRNADYAKTIGKIAFFQGLSLRQVRQLLDAGTVDRYVAGRFLCRKGDKSTELFILLAGVLSVKNRAVELARIEPVQVVGEMGMVTGLPRSASIAVVEEATVVAIGRLKFDALLKSDVDLALKVYRNMIGLISQRLRAGNERLSGQLATSMV